MRAILSALLSLVLNFVFTTSVFAQAICAPYSTYSNPNPTLPCIYGGYSYDSLAVEADTNSFFYKGANYSLTDNDWWWSLLSGPYETCDGLMVSGGSYNCSHNLSFNKSGARFFGVGPSYTDTLTAFVNPNGSGTLTIDDTSCQDYPCQRQFAPNTDVVLSAAATPNYAFGYWIDGTTELYENPITITINGGRALTAKFFKTFRETAGNFYKNVDDVGGECVVYVRYETGIPYDDFHGAAYTTYQQAINAGYMTSRTIPRVSSIIVFAVQGKMTVGHVGIVTEINGNLLTLRDSNWKLDGIVKKHTVDVSRYTILGYIYPKP